VVLMIHYEYLDGTDNLPHLFRFVVEPGTPRWWDFHAIEQWLIERWGEPGYDNIREFRYTYWSQYSSRLTVIIRDDADAVEFKLRWWNCHVENP
jgi:hypothetical protein